MSDDRYALPAAHLNALLAGAEDTTLNGDALRLGYVTAFVMLLREFPDGCEPLAAAALLRDLGEHQGPLSGRDAALGREAEAFVRVALGEYRLAPFADWPVIAGAVGDLLASLARRTPATDAVTEALALLARFEGAGLRGAAFAEEMPDPRLAYPVSFFEYIARGGLPGATIIVRRDYEHDDFAWSDLSGEFVRADPERRWDYPRSAYGRLLLGYVRDNPATPVFSDLIAESSGDDDTMWSLCHRILTRICRSLAAGGFDWLMRLVIREPELLPPLHVDAVIRVALGERTLDIDDVDDATVLGLMLRLVQYCGPRLPELPEALPAVIAAAEYGTVEEGHELNFLD
ncbi:hypothetical protein [Phytomonospora endophytica]|uniref:Uncharacterized protein n=1 Tax=Phytomonospora endophytica TaxID=714109 RepID=A0A841FXQ5_9ACTN|nr:hypothetical protein [Phytomonospora endophytica]MBB6039503.1 hypothetical protein [Phytomonospora endophytica]GIG70230.1 hypothetical protein Pen01_65250 [Phytomonospora endophytica]